MTLLSCFVVLNVFLSDQEDPADNNLMRYAYCSRRKVSFSPRGNALIAINAQHDCQLNVFWISLSFYKQDIWWICSGYVSKQHNHVCTGWCMGQKWTLRRRLPMRHLAEGKKWKFTWIFFEKWHAQSWALPIVYYIQTMTFVIWYTRKWKTLWWYNEMNETFPKRCGFTLISHLKGKYTCLGEGYNIRLIRSVFVYSQYTPETLMVFFSHYT